MSERPNYSWILEKRFLLRFGYYTFNYNYYVEHIKSKRNPDLLYRFTYTRRLDSRYLLIEIIPPSKKEVCVFACYYCEKKPFEKTGLWTEELDGILRDFERDNTKKEKAVERRKQEKEERARKREEEKVNEVESFFK